MLCQPKGTCPHIMLALGKLCYKLCITVFVYERLTNGAAVLAHLDSGDSEPPNSFGTCSCENLFPFIHIM